MIHGVFSMTIHDMHATFISGFLPWLDKSVYSSVSRTKPTPVIIIFSRVVPSP